jgi:hypothetical protein
VAGERAYAIEEDVTRPQFRGDIREMACRTAATRTGALPPGPGGRLC